MAEKRVRTKWDTKSYGASKFTNVNYSTTCNWSVEKHNPAKLIDPNKNN